MKILIKKLNEYFMNCFKKSCISFNKPIFIWGMPRGGTTILHDFLYLSDDLASFNIKKNRLKKGIWGDLHYGENIPDILKSISSPIEGFPRVWFDTNAYSNFLKQKHSKRDQIKVFRQIKKIEQEWFFKTTYKKKRILEKSPNYVMILELVNKLFPNSLHICVLRDPRAVVNSFARLIKNSPKTTGKVLRKGDTILRFNGYEKISNLPTYEIFSWQMEKILEYSDAFKKKVNGRLSFWYHENIYEDLPYYLKKLTKRLDIEFPKLIKYFTSEYIEKNYPWWRNEKLKKDPFYTNFLTDREISTLKRLDVLSKKMGYDENVVGKLNKRIYEI